MFFLASNCFITNGIRRSLLIDLQRFKQYFLSSELGELLSKRVIPEKDIPEKYKPIIETLVGEDILLQLSQEEIDLFPQIDDIFDVPSFINDAIIDVSDSVPNFSKIFNELKPLLCRHVEIRFFKSIDISVVLHILEEVKDSVIEVIDIYMPYNSFYERHEEYLRILDTNMRLRMIYIHSCPIDLKIESIDRCLFTHEFINDEKHCGVVSQFHFAVNNLTYFESLNHNSCLNRKIGIDVNGEIKNCPSMKQSYGNIINTKLITALNKPGFKENWNITKDKVKICQDCEFRNICTDCRAYLENPNDIYSKPLKCGYDPYTSTWSDWSQNPLKHKAIESYQMQDLIESSNRN